MKKKLSFPFIVFSVFILLANMRAPYMRTNSASRTLTQKTPATLVVLEEDLSFECEAPYEGDIGTVTQQKRFAQVTAVYLVDAGKAGECAFEFLMPDNVEVESSVNGKRCAAENTVIEKGKAADGWSVRMDRSLCRATFVGKLLQGENIIRVSYRQPVGVTETHYGYFTKSRYASGFGYELWPLKEWKLAEDFTLNVDVRTADYSSLRRTLFGSRNVLRLNGASKNDEAQFVPCDDVRYSQEDGFLRARVTWGRSFPDLLHVSYGEE